MFRFPQRAASAAATPERPRPLLRRAALFAAGLVLLWVALQLAPKQTPPPAPTPLAETATADDGVVALSRPASPSLLSAGNIAVLVLLMGGIGVAVYLRRRSKDNGVAALSLHSMGRMDLAPSQQLRLVRCGDDVLLLGVTSGQITLLKTYDFMEFPGVNSILKDGGSEAAERPRASVASDEASFARLLRQQVGGPFTYKKSEAPC